MKKFLLIIVIVVIVWVAWYFVSPLFLSKTVNEPFEDSVPLQKIGEDVFNEEAVLQHEKEIEEARSMLDIVVEEDMPVVVKEAGPTQTAQGAFSGADRFHEASGNASIYELSDGTRVVRLEDFMVTNGPDLHVLLTTHPDPQGRQDIVESSPVDLGKLKGNVGNQNYTIPEGVDLENIQSVVIYCDPFHVIFGTASLQNK